MKIDIHRYTPDEYSLLKDMIIDSYKDQQANQPYIIDFLNRILKGDPNVSHLSVNLRNRNFLFKQDLINLPKFINYDKSKTVITIIKWRFKIGK